MLVRTVLFVGLSVLAAPALPENGSGGPKFLTLKSKDLRARSR